MSVSRASAYQDYLEDCGAPEVKTIATETRRTRTERKLECGHTVPAGTSYRRWVGLVDGEFCVAIDCMYCWAGEEPTNKEKQ